jgi:hypothetical protein
MKRKNRILKKTQKALGYVRVGAMIPPNLYAALCLSAARNGRSMTEDLVAAIARHVERGEA